MTKIDIFFENLPSLATILNLLLYFDSQFSYYHCWNVYQFLN